MVNVSHYRNIPNVVPHLLPCVAHSSCGGEQPWSDERRRSTNAVAGQRTRQAARANQRRQPAHDAAVAHTSRSATSRHVPVLPPTTRLLHPSITRTASTSFHPPDTHGREREREETTSPARYHYGRSNFTFLSVAEREYLPDAAGNVRCETIGTVSRGRGLCRKGHRTATILRKEEKQAQRKWRPKQ